MAEAFHAEQTSIRPGKKLPLLGIYLETTNGWVRWGLPIACGMAIALGLWILS